MKNSLIFLIWMMIMLPMLYAGNIIKQTWVPIVVSDMTTFVPYTLVLPDKDNDGIDDATDTPVAYAQSLSIIADGNGYPISLRGSDNDSPITYIVATQPLHGTLTGTAPNLSYTPKNGYIGEDSFTFRVSDGVHFSSIVSINIVINTSPFPVHSEADASAFLSRATFGAQEEEIDRLVSLGNYEQWIDQQFGEKPTYHATWIEENLRGIGIPDFNSSVENWFEYSDTLGYVQRDAWWHIATNAPDQLRQRVALALSEIFVVSRTGSLMNFPDARVSYYDTLIKNAFGNFETLLRDVTYHPAMGKYLSYLCNPKANPETGAHPDENYAREVMQLFTIGLNELNQDGTPKLHKGKPISTYTQVDIQEMARVFTGLTADSGDFYDRWAFDSSYYNRTKAMKAFESEHDQGSKTVLGHTIHTGSTIADINAALHMLFMHENTAPFISKQLIQRLVTSNPTPAYVARVAAIFNNNGRGERGDLFAVIKAILLDDEALREERHPDNFGKFREPLLYFTHLFRAFHAKGNPLNQIDMNDTASYQYESFHFNGTDMTQQEGALEALTVFNYFRPTDGPASLVKQHLAAPELMIYGKQGIDEVLMGIINKNSFIYNTYDLVIDLDLDKEIAYVRAHNIEGLLDHLSLLLTANTMSTQNKNKIVDYLKHATDGNNDALSAETIVRYAISLVMTSPAYALQR